jgi:hypothetical protein
MAPILLFLFGSLSLARLITFQNMGVLAWRRFEEIGACACPRDREWWLLFSLALNGAAGFVFFGWQAVDAMWVGSRPVTSVPPVIWLSSALLLIATVATIWARSVSWHSRAWRWFVGMEVIWFLIFSCWMVMHR